jgi:hypothetical protein
MFNLETAIADWRKQMLAAGIKTPVLLEELGIHLREGIERQVKSGLSEPIAFEVSVKQVGQPQSLRSEFKKVERNIVKRYTSSRFSQACAFGWICLLLLALPLHEEHGRQAKAVFCWAFGGVS